MLRRTGGHAVVALGVGLALLSGLPGCDSGGAAGGQRNADQPGDDTFSPAGVTFGGVIPDPEEVEAIPQAINPYAAAGAGAPAAFPASTELTDLPPVGNQGNLGSCTAWASAYAAATYTANRQFAWGVNTAEHQASPGYLYAQLLATDALPCGSGTYIQTAMDLLIQAGCSSLGTVEYRDDMCFDSPSAADAANFRIGSYNRILWTDRNAMRGELAAGRIIVFGAQLYDDFAEFTGSGVYQGSGVLLTQGAQHAAHAMAIVGYDDTRGAYRIMNSWSPQWGDDGFMWMVYETFEATAYEAYSTEPRGDREPPNPEPGPGPVPPPTPGPDPNGYLDEAFQFAEVDPATGQKLIYLVFFYRFDEAVFIRSITVTDPFGDSATQAYEVWYSDGYVYFVRNDGFQWQSGTYTLVFDTETQAGNSVAYTGQVEVKPLGVGDEGGGTCLNTCYFAFDGECDDGGPGSLYGVCDHGTDCNDCGVRDADVVDDETGGLCTDDCPYAFDGECDDGGPGSVYGVCDLGTDCTDCGGRDADVGDGGTGDLCTDTCPYAFDGECDDGGPGSVYGVCTYGTDCADCGPRSLGGGAKVIRTPHVFRGVPVVVPAEAARLPAAGVRPGVLGANRRPAEVIPANSG